MSTDELLEYKLSESEEKIANKKRNGRFSEGGTTDERIAFVRNAIACYSSDCEIKQNLAACLYHLWYDTRNANLLNEIENLCTSVVAECKD